MMQTSGVGDPSQSATESVSCIRYSEMCERNWINGADSAKSFRTVQVSWSRQTPTTESGSLVEKLSRGELLIASRMDIGFILCSELVRYLERSWPAPSPVPACLY